MERIDSIKLDGMMESTCARDSVLPRALSGELVIIRQCLQSLEVFDQIRNMLVRSVGEVCGEAAADQVRSEGPEQIHQHVGIDRIEKIYARIRSDLAGKMPAIMARMFRLFGAEDPFYIHDASLIRMMVPYDVMKSKPREGKKHLGKLTLHGPHHDHYQNVPVNAINAWIAVGRVDHNNGMFIYPEIWGKNLPQGDGAVRDDQYLGHPISVELDPGDALIFHSHHMHASRLNTTDETRVVLTNRVCLEKPRYPDLTHPQKYYRSSAFPADLDGSNVFLVDGFVGDSKKYLKTGLRRLLYQTAGKLGVDGRNLPKETSSTKHVSLASREDAFTQLTEGEIAVLDEKTCMARVGGEIVAFRRRCPHEGADLALGFIDDGQIVCPYHGLRFCPRTGEANCSAVAGLKTETLQPVVGSA